MPKQPLNRTVLRLTLFRAFLYLTYTIIATVVVLLGLAVFVCTQSGHGISSMSIVIVAAIVAIPTIAGIRELQENVRDLKEEY